MKVYNVYLQYKQKYSIGFPFDEVTMGGRLPSTCISCRACEQHCPQHIAISDAMRGMVPVFE